jgi:Caspase domain/Bacterial Ig domain
MYQSLHDPDLVREQLAGDPDGEVRRMSTVVDLEKVLDSGQVPNVVIVSPANGGASKDEVITVEARIADMGGGIGRVEWRVNGVTISAVSNDPGSNKDRTVTQKLVLEAGENTVEVVAYNRRNLLASLPSRTTVTWNAPPNQRRPVLFVIAVGINDYGDTLFRHLSQAVVDAKAFGAAMKAAGEGLYAEVDVTYVLDADATIEKLERVIDEVGAKMHPRDTFVFFAAAHGKSENGRFHVIPQDYRSDAPGTLADKSIGQDRLQDWFANRIKARRGLILLDTCESGALVASRASGIDLANSEASMGRLNEATGRPVLTASAADQAALEGYNGHGVFTYALLDALVNGDTNNDGQIELSELAAHIQELAPKLSQELRDRRGQATASAPKSRAAEQLGGAAIAARYQKPKIGSRGEDFPLVMRLKALPAVSAAQ